VGHIDTGTTLKSFIAIFSGADGSLKTSFGTGGVFIFEPVTGERSRAKSLIFNRDSHFFVTGETETGTTGDFF